ncbi:MAG: hypothetical protein GY851_27095 [bacterium]|nr:hypothetical protein [bacterium]
MTGLQDGLDGAGMETWRSEDVARSERGQEAATGHSIVRAVRLLDNPRHDLR